MRNWINLVEGVEDNRLYHGTSIVGFCHIASINLLGNYGGENQASFSLSQSVGEAFAKNAVSLCADGQLAQYSDFHNDPNNAGWDGTPYTAHRAEMIAGGHGVVFVFNRKALHQAYDFKAVNFQSDDIETIDLGYSGDEAEECVFEPVKNLDRFITGILIDREGFKKYCAFVRETLPDDADAMKIIAAGEAWVARFP